MKSQTLGWLGMGVSVGLLVGTGMAETRTWGGSVGYWSDAVAWGGTSPQQGDDVVILSGAVTLTNASASLGTLTISGTGKLIFSGADSVVTAGEIAISGVGVRVEHTANTALAAVDDVWPVDGLIHFVCTNFYLGGGAILDADARGWAGGSDQTSASAYGPGAGSRRGGGGYGGYGGGYNSILFGPTYGNPIAPDQPGSGGGGHSGSIGSRGGGLVRIHAEERVQIDGVVRANGAKGSTYNGGASGGGIWITCATVAGSGAVTANGGDQNSGSGSGGGGRIAVIYNPLQQASADPVSILFEVRPGAEAGWPGDLGTLYFPDQQFLKETIRHSGQWLAPGLNEWTPHAVTVDGGHLRFPELTTLAVTDTVVITGSRAMLEVGGAEIVDGYPCRDTNRRRIHYSGFNPRFFCGGDLILANGGTLRVFAGSTNTPGMEGALVEVGGQMRLDSGSWVYPSSHPYDGASPRFVMQVLTIAEGAGFNADCAGYPGRGGTANAAGYGEGKGGSRSGAGYGGKGGGGIPGETYGDETCPTQPGSGGGSGNATVYQGGRGGGSIRLEIAGRLTLDGVLQATGGNAEYYGGAGSGGGVFVHCRRFSGSGQLQAHGGDGPGSYLESGGAGGGGRIAVWRQTHDFTGTATALNGIRDRDNAQSAPGTVVYVDIPAEGTVFLLR